MMRNLIYILLIGCFVLPISAQEKRPSWVGEKPVSLMCYTGIGMAKKTDKNYLVTAKQNALNDLVSEIRVEVASSSIMNKIEENGNYKELFEQNIRTSAKEEIEHFNLAGTWQNEDEYWVYYELFKDDYDNYVKARREQAVRIGFDYWVKGKSSLQGGNLSSAIDFFCKGLESIQSVINQDLTCSYENRVIDVGNELYHSLITAFQGVVIVSDSTAVSGKCFHGILSPIGVGVYKDNVALTSLRLKVSFVSGAGDVSEMIPTDLQGRSNFYVRNITSKQSQQELQISVDSQLLDNYKSSFVQTIKQQLLDQLPKTNVVLNVEKGVINAYLDCRTNENEALFNATKNLLTNNYFNLVPSPANADVTVKVIIKLRKGTVVPGDLYNFIETFSTLELSFINNRGKGNLLDYSISNYRTLVPEKSSMEKAKGNTAREMIKRMKRELVGQLKKVTIDTEGELSQVETQIEKKEVPVAINPSVPKFPPVVIKPVIETKPVTKPLEPSVIEGELLENIFVRFSNLKTINDKTIIVFKIINRTNNDFSILQYKKSLKIINGNGEEMTIHSLSIGSIKDNWSVSATIVPEIPTTFSVTVDKLDSVALFQLQNKDHVLKLRNLK